MNELSLHMFSQRKSRGKVNVMTKIYMSRSTLDAAPQIIDPSYNYCWATLNSKNKYTQRKI